VLHTASASQIKDLIGVFFINSSTGRATEGFGATPFSGQVFFNIAPGQTGNLPRMIFNGPRFFGWDASIIKNIRIKSESKLNCALCLSFHLKAV
jgi:hypothetical protein